MNRIQALFLELYSSALCEKRLEDSGYSEEECTDLLHIAYTQAVLPFFYNACYAMDSFKRLSNDSRKNGKTIRFVPLFVRLPRRMSF